MKQLSDLIEQSKDKILDRSKAHAIMLSLNMCNASILNADYKDPKEGFRDILQENIHEDIARS